MALAFGGMVLFEGEENNKRSYRVNLQTKLFLTEFLFIFPDMYLKDTFE